MFIIFFVFIYYNEAKFYMYGIHEFFAITNSGYGYTSNDGKTWGNKDLEFHAWLSCQVLEEEWTFTDDAGVIQRRQWYERWGPTFNGLHLIPGIK